MSKFDSFYCNVDRLNAAIARAEQYLLTHPTGDAILRLSKEDNVWFHDQFDEVEEMENNEVFGLGLHNKHRLCIWGLWFGKGDELSEDLDLIAPLHLLPAKLRVKLAGLIPELIKLADSNLEIKVGAVDEVIQAIDVVLPQPESTSAKPKRSIRKKQ